MTTPQDWCDDVRRYIEDNMKCVFRETHGVKTHSPSGCPRCQALAALGYIEETINRRETE